MSKYPVVLETPNSPTPVSQVQMALVEKGLFKQSVPTAGVKLLWKCALGFSGLFGEAACTQKKGLSCKKSTFSDVCHSY